MKEVRRKAKLTQRMIEATHGIKSTRIIITDTEIKGFRLLVGETSKTFLLEKRITGASGSARKFKIGSYPVLSLEKARETAKHWSHLCERGKDPTKTQITESDGQLAFSAKKTVAPTLGASVELHFKYKKPSEKTQRTYRSTFRNQFKDWLHRPLSEIKGTEVIERGHEIAEEVSNSRATAALSNLRAVWNTAKAFCDERGIGCPGNPLRMMRINKLFAHEADKVVIPITRVGQFIDLLEELVSDQSLPPCTRRTLQLYQLSLFLGMRNGEARQLKWEYIDLETGYFKLPGHTVKNRKTHIKPIGCYAKQVLRQLFAEREAAHHPYVFPSTQKAKTPYMSRSEEAKHLVIERMGGNFWFSPHALRRTFISLADEISTPRKVLKNLVNHISGDVTDGYCVRGFNPKKEAPHLNRIEEAFLILRDKYRKGEDIPELAIDLFPKEGEQKIASLLEEIAELKAALTVASDNRYSDPRPNH